MPQKDNHPITILLAVWGEEFIKDFLQLSLPSLLAPGNIPALAHVHQTRFVFLTRSRDVPVFEMSAAYLRLKALVTVAFIFIDDLIVFGEYSATLTLAYNRAIQTNGAHSLKTYFIFLTSDYIVADGSMRGLMKYIQQGYSGICAGNFQVIKEEIEPFLRQCIDPHTAVLAIPPRTLVKESFKSLHPVVFASHCDQSIVRNYRANRFFVRLDTDVMAGRFYLQHMLCIKPETLDYDISSSCDYSFIPAMCPSGHIITINDSDDYFVIEIQSKQHELTFIDKGPYQFKRLAIALAEWTTKQHRENAKQSIYFHARALAAKDKEVIEKKLEDFIQHIDTYLSAYKVQPYINHPYWAGAVNSIYAQQAIKKEKDERYYFDLNTTGRHASFFKRMYYRFFGITPQVFPWHFRFQEQRLIRQRLASFIDRKSETAIFYQNQCYDFMQYATWFKTKYQIETQYCLADITNTPALYADLQAKPCTRAVLFLHIEDLQKMASDLTVIKSLLIPAGELLVIILNDKLAYRSLSGDFLGEWLAKMNAIVMMQYQTLKIESLHNNLSLLGNLAIENITRYFLYSKKKRFLFYALLGVPSIFCSLIWNSLPAFHKGHCTHLLLTLRTEGRAEGLAGERHAS